MRLMGVRAAPSGESPSLKRSLVRVVGLLLAIIPLGAGFSCRRSVTPATGAPGYLADTTVVYEP